MSVVVGGNFADGKGNATGYLSYLDAKPTRLSERDYSACQLGGTGHRRPLRRIGQLELLPGLDGPAAGGIYSVAGQRPHRSSGRLGATEVTSPPSLFNSNPYMNLKHGRERYQGGVFAKYEWSEKATLYTDFMFMKDQAEHGRRAVRPVHRQRGSPSTATTRC